MAEYRRYFVPGGTYFFTVVTEGRAPILCTPEARSILRAVFLETRSRWPFRVEAIVLIPDHLHALWSLPPGDANYSRRWAFLKKEFTRRWIARGGVEQAISHARSARRRRGIWQPRYWEHLVVDEDDLERHFDYVHYNPVKHGLATCPRDWPFSSFHRWVRSGAYPRNWACGHGGSAPDFRAIEATVGE